MRLFYLKPVDETASQPEASADEGTLRKRTAAEPQFLGFGRAPKSVETVEETLDMSVLSTEYEQRIEEVFRIVQKKTTSTDGGIVVDKVTVKLGVDSGGRIGWFVEGSLNVSLAFEVEFSVNRK
ncbi:hypothetical protein AB1K70_26710 [Bremerella sp. JC770]|uniref:hypothetical protein n=1 Tax=Bremerella sp. JC770 TaxID=3232137 RepID=UPI00345AF9C7